MSSVSAVTGALMVALATAALAHAGTFAYVTNSAGLVLNPYRANADGTLVALATTGTPAGSYGIVVSPDGTSVYVANRDADVVSQYTVAPGGTLFAKSPPSVPAGNAPRGIAISPDGTSVYVTNSDEDTISQYDVGLGGALAAKGTPKILPPNVGNFPHGVGVSPDGSSVYVANTNSNRVWQYDVGPGGALTPKSTPSILADTEPFADVVITPDGANLYVPNRAGNSISQYTIGVGGLLTAKSDRDVLGDHDPRRAAISPDGSSVYVTNEETNRISQFSVGPDGVLVDKSPATVAAGGTGPYPVAVSPDGDSVYVGNRYSNDVSQYTMDSGGHLTLMDTDDATNSPFGIAVVATGTIIVRKNAVPDSPQDFGFTAGGGLTPGSFQLDDDSDPALSDTRTFADVAPRSGYSITETVPAGWYPGAATCSDGSPPTNIGVSPGETLTCTLTNSVTYPRPGGGTPLRVPLVLAFEECTSPDSTHAEPLDEPSCLGPILESTQLTTGTAGLAQSFARWQSKPGDPATELDEADIEILVNLGDVRQQAGGTDYTGYLAASPKVRISDRAIDATGDSDPAPVGAGTASDFPFSFPIGCTATPGPGGASCTTSTSADSLVPGTVAEGRRSVIGILSLDIMDAGSNGTGVSPGCQPTCGDGDERVFLEQGIFTP